MDPTFKKAWLQSWKWAAITAAVVTSPVIGKVAKVSFERFLGTIAGQRLMYRSLQDPFLDALDRLAEVSQLCTIVTATYNTNTNHAISP